MLHSKDLAVMWGAVGIGTPGVRPRIAPKQSRRRHVVAMSASGVTWGGNHANEGTYRGPTPTAPLFLPLDPSSGPRLLVPEPSGVLR